MTRNLLSWKEGQYILIVKFRGSREELKDKLQELIEVEKQDD